MKRVTLVPIKAEDREQFIVDCQESFRYGSLEEFGERNTHLDKDGEVMSRGEIEAVIGSPTAESYLIVDGSIIPIKALMSRMSAYSAEPSDSRKS